jgi:glucose/arabinose dehydrogenase
MRRLSAFVLMAMWVSACAHSGTPGAQGTERLPTTVVPNPAVAATPSQVTTFPDPTAFEWVPIASGLASPVDIQFANHDSGRMFLVEQAGRIRIVENGQLLARPFLDIRDRVNSTGNEQGLLGLAFDPNYATTGWLFVNYTDTQNHDVIARFHVSADGDLADAASESILVSVDDPFPNHNGGVLTFGPDGYLYAGLGDGGGANDPLGNGQNTNTLLGKILRLDVDQGSPYTIPSDNPFAQGGGRAEIWAYGLRNPWRLSFDKATGDLYIGDVGQDSWEEVDFLPVGSVGGIDFGWNYREGSHPFAGNPPASLHLTYPVAEYSHDQGNCSITGGFVYRGKMPQWQGVYLYGDYCSGKIWGLLHTPDANSGMPWQSKMLFETGENITSFGQDPIGEVYFADRAGTVYCLQE